MATRTFIPYEYKTTSAHGWVQDRLPMQLSAPQRFCSEVLPSEMAQKAFASDMAALRGADATVLVAPCGASAHLELGVAIGAGQLTIVLLDDPIKTPELMWLAADVIVESLDEACAALQPPLCTACLEQIAAFVITEESFMCRACLAIQHTGRRRQTVEPATPRERSELAVSSWRRDSSQS